MESEQGGSEGEKGAAEEQFQVTPAGRELLLVLFVAERWLQKAPGGPVDVEGKEADRVTDTLRDGWSSGIVPALATEPLTKTELGRALDTMSRESIAAKLAELREIGLIEARPSEGEGASYAVSDWQREGVGLLAAGVRAERRHSGEETAPIGAADVEAALLLTLPLLKLPAELSGYCRLLVELPGSVERRAAGAMVRVDDGRVASCDVSLEGTADGWAMGSPAAWLDAIVVGETGELQFGGEEGLPRALIERLHLRLFQYKS